MAWCGLLPADTLQQRMRERHARSTAPGMASAGGLPALLRSGMSAREAAAAEQLLDADDSDVAAALKSWWKGLSVAQRLQRLGLSTDELAKLSDRQVQVQMLSMLVMLAMLVMLVRAGPPLTFRHPPLQALLKEPPRDLLEQSTTAIPPTARGARPQASKKGAADVPAAAHNSRAKAAVREAALKRRLERQWNPHFCTSLWLCGCVAVAVWLCGCVAVACVAVGCGLCGCVAGWLGGCVHGCRAHTLTWA